MIVRGDSRFRNAALYNIQPGDLRYWGLPVRVKLNDGEPYVTHYYKEGERPDQIATYYYSNPHLGWVIVEVNDIFRWWDELVVGQPIKIPTRESLARMLGS
jgi:hypothetical protein